MFTLGRILAYVINAMTVLGGLVITLMMLHVSLDVFFRYFFDTPLPGTITVVSYYYMVVAAFIPLAFAEQKGAHISVEVVSERLPAYIQKHLASFSYLFSATVFSLLTVRTWEEAEKKRSFGASIVQGNDSISIWVTYYVLPLGCGLMTLVAIYKLLVNCFGIHTGLDTEQAEPDELQYAD